jgi:hypothetical protein
MMKLDELISEREAGRVDKGSLNLEDILRH